MKLSCIVLTTIIVVAIISVCVMVKYATEVTVEERRRIYNMSTLNVLYHPKHLSVVTLKHDIVHCNKFPFLAAIMKTGSSWHFRCFGAVIRSWIVTSAHCISKNQSYHALIHDDFMKNITQSHPIKYWFVHEQYNNVTSLHDIAIGRVNTYSGQVGKIDEKIEFHVDISVWKTVISMELESYLTNEVVYHSEGTNNCENMAINDDSVFCLNMSKIQECLFSEFGPVFAGNKVVGVLKQKPNNCTNKLAMFTNVSYYYKWIYQRTLDNFL